MKLAASIQTFTENFSKSIQLLKISFPKAFTNFRSSCIVRMNQSLQKKHYMTSISTNQMQDTDHVIFKNKINNAVDPRLLKTRS